MAPLTPTWTQPSHPTIQTVVYPSNPNEFTTKSLSKVTLSPFGLFAKMAFPPCTRAEKATYATVQMGKKEHLNLNSDLVYINHSCVPSVIFDTTSLSILAGPNGLKENQELTFFYPSTEWEMAQGFECFCGHDSCRGFISGAKDMPAEKLEGQWLNAHIRLMLEEQSSGVSETREEENGKDDEVEKALLISLAQAQLALDASKEALRTYRTHSYSQNGHTNTVKLNGALNGNAEIPGGEKRRGVTSREMSGEMGGDTVL
ncbi:hypothetical protein G7Y89_g10351 [Cudoniella acicularis]|uniref:Post-SET domain-containing protein n=1 Tax=Cudoniella acicularis TaxID=354080 RepID=A0A8H4VZB1_9HELO|nr:hypothetical protein G7Y89_g10351 [Cudoniella acicularis]